jgi:exodeoxyribonuclease V alpha subunit
MIRKDPYQLMNFRGCGFKRCDALYQELGLQLDRLRRQAFSLWYVLAMDTEGHTWFPVDYAFAGLRSLVSGPKVDPERALELATRICRIRPEGNGAVSVLRSAGNAIAHSGGSRFVAVGSKAATESRLAELVADAMTDTALWPAIEEIEGIDDHQRTELSRALAGPVGILGGRPGSGKTFTAARLVAVLIKKFGANAIAIGAPTGKAATRLSEVLADYGVPIRAKTWHSTLGVEQHSEGSGWSFAHNERNPLPHKILIGDETSMNDTPLMCSIFRARAKGVQVLLIGDCNQLPPVGHGAPLRDMIAAGVPYGELKEIKRNSGGIVEACADICDDRPWKAGDNLVIVERPEPQQQIDAMLRELRTAADSGKDPIWDCQVIVAVNKKSQLSRRELNEILQRELNSRPGVKGSPFRVGDKICNTRNGFLPLVEVANADSDDMRVNSRGEAFVANGELAEIVAVEDKFFIARLTGPVRTVRIPRGKASDDDGEGGDESDDQPKTGCAWDLGYAISCHKSQGAEFPIVIVMVDEYAGARRVCSREWLYTAISRAKERCVLIGRKSTADKFCQRVAIGNRKTFLRELILLNQAKRVLVEL